MQAARRAPLAYAPVAAIAAVVVAFDQWTKWWALTSLDHGREINLIAHWLTLRLTHNSGAAFSLLEGATWVVTIVMLSVTAGLIYYLPRAQSRFSRLIFALGIGGALGNIIDRLFRDDGWGTGRVVDMIKYGDWFVGNVADIAIVGAGVAAVIATWLGYPLLTKPAAAAASSVDEEPGKQERKTKVDGAE